MKFVFLFAFVAFCVNCVFAIVCPPNYCLTVKCASEVVCPDTYSLVPTFCGCCNRCVENIGENGTCLQLLGSPPAAECAQGLQCCSGICRKKCDYRKSTNADITRHNHDRRH